jgi:CheY-like chemotaxis protein
MTDVAKRALRVLIVEDNRDSADMLDEIVREWGHATQVAYDGLEAVRMAEEFRPDAVLLDIGLPKIDGHEVARRIRQAPWGRQPLLVAVTGWGQDADRRRSKAAGIDHHLVKPVDPAALENVLAAVRPDQ